MVSFIALGSLPPPRLHLCPLTKSSIWCVWSTIIFGDFCELEFKPRSINQKEACSDTQSFRKLDILSYFDLTGSFILNKVSYIQRYILMKWWHICVQNVVATGQISRTVERDKMAGLWNVWSRRHQSGTHQAVKQSGRFRRFSHLQCNCPFHNFAPAYYAKNEAKRLLDYDNPIIFWLHFLYNLNLWFSYHSGWIMTLYDFNNVPKVQGTYVQSSYYNIVQCTSAQSVKNAAWLSSPSCEDLAPSQSIELGQACTAHRTPYTAHRTLHNA